MKRDNKGLYRKALNRELKDFTGISSPYEAPENQCLMINTASQCLEESVENILLGLIKDRLISIPSKYLINL